MSHRIIIIKGSSYGDEPLPEAGEGISAEVTYHVPHDLTPEQVSERVKKIWNKLTKLYALNEE